MTLVLSRSPVSKLVLSRLVSSSPNLTPPLNFGGCITWLDASKLTLPNNSLVSQWPDLSGNNNSASQSTSANMPTFISNAINGYGGISFVAANSTYLKFPTNVGLIMLSGYVTYLLVYSNATQVNSSAIIAAQNGSSSTRHMISNATTVNKLSTTYTTGSSGVNNDTPTDSTYYGSPKIVSVVQNNYLYNFYDNGVSVISASNAGSESTTVGASIGAKPSNGAQASTEYIHEVIIYNKALSSIDRYLVEKYLGSKWGISV